MTDITNEQMQHAAVEGMRALASLHRPPLESVLQMLAAEYNFRFPDAMRFFSERQNDVAKRYAAYARENMSDDGVIEVDEVAIASISEDRGAYVLAWLWVDQSDVGVSEREQEAGLLATEQQG